MFPEEYPATRIGRLGQRAYARTIARRITGPARSEARTYGAHGPRVERDLERGGRPGGRIAPCSSRTRHPRSTASRTTASDQAANRSSP